MAPGTLTLLAVISASPPSGAASGCPIRVVPADSAGPWIDAAGALDRELRRAKPGERDCREVEVRADSLTPWVAVVTTDGRRAQRPLGNSRELIPTVEGMLITVPLGNPDAAVDLTQTASVSTPASVGPHLLLTAAAGARVSFPGTMASSVVDIAGGVTLARWELGLFGTWNPGLPGSSAHAAPPSLAVGAAAGRRQRSGIGDVIVGTRLGALLPSALVAGSGNGQVDDTETPYGGAWTPAVAAYCALAVRPTSLLRFRPQLMFEWLPFHSNAIPMGVPDSPPVAQVPTWSLTLSVGAESGAL